MKKITYKLPRTSSIHETVDSFMDHLERVREEQKRLQTQYLFGSMLDELVLASIEDQRNWGPGINLKKFGGSISLSPSSVRLGPITQPHVDALIEGTLPFVASAFTNTTRDEITFNGSPMKDVISYDEITGEVHYYEVDWHSNNYIPDSDDPTGYRTAKSKGQVQVQTKYKAPASSAATTDLNKQPYDGCGIDPNYAPWYTHGIPSFTETALNVEFGFHGFTVALCHDLSINKWMSFPMSELTHLMIDGTPLGSSWSLIGVEELCDGLRLCFVHMMYDPTCGNWKVTNKAGLDSVGLRGLAHVCDGYPHVYKIVKVLSASHSLHTPVSISHQEAIDPKLWQRCYEVQVTTNQLYLGYDPVTASVMKKLC